MSNWSFGDSGAEQAEAPEGLSALRRRYIRPVFLLVSLAAIVVSAYKVVQFVVHQVADTRYTARVLVSLDESSGEYSATPSDPPIRAAALRVAIAPVVSPERSLEMYHEFVNYLAARVEMTPQFLQRQTYAEVNDLVRYGQCDLAFVCTYAFVRGEREFNMKLLAAPQVKGQSSYRSLIIVRRDSPAVSLLDLKDRVFASADMLSTSGWLYPATWLIEKHMNPRRFFSHHVITGSHDRSLLSVISGDVDGAAVDSLVYERMSAEDGSISAKTRVIQESGSYGTPPLVVSPQIDPRLKARLLQVLTSMDRDEQGRRVLSHIGIDRFVEARSEAYDGVRAAALLWESQP